MSCQVYDARYKKKLLANSHNGLLEALMALCYEPGQWRGNNDVTITAEQVTTGYEAVSGMLSFAANPAKATELYVRRPDHLIQAAAVLGVAYQRKCGLRLE